MTSDTTPPQAVRVPPPSKHQLALMIWLAVFPTLTALNLALGDWLRTWPPCRGPSSSRRSPSRGHVRRHAPLHQARGHLLRRS
jgi:hypothetical protein